MKLARVPLYKLSPPSKPIRTSIDDTKLAELAEDITRNGVKVPLLVKHAGEGYEVIDGHRRLLASVKAKVESVPIIVLTASDGAPELVSLSANLYRQEMSPAEEGALFAELFEQCGSDIDKVCARVGKSRSYVDSRLALLGGDRAVLQALAEGEINLSVATELNRIHDDGWRHYYLAWAVSQGAKAELVKLWRQVANGQGPMTAAPEAPPEAPAAGLPDVSEVYRCAVCKSDERKFELGVAMIHHDCRAALEIAIASAAEREVKASPCT